MNFRIPELKVRKVKPRAQGPQHFRDFFLQKASMQRADIPGCGRTDHKSGNSVTCLWHNTTHKHTHTQTQHVWKQHVHVFVPRALPQRLLLLLVVVVVVAL